MKQSDYDKLLIKWIKNHYWDSLEKDKDLILRHLRTFTGDTDAVLTNAMHSDAQKQCPSCVDADLVNISTCPKCGYIEPWKIF